MTAARSCRSCQACRQGTTIPVVILGNVVEDWHLCDRCWLLLELGLSDIDPGDALDAYRDGRGPRLTPVGLGVLLHRGMALVERQHVRRWLDDVKQIIGDASTEAGRRD